MRQLAIDEVDMHPQDDRIESNHVEAPRDYQYYCYYCYELLLFLLRVLLILARWRPFLSNQHPWNCQPESSVKSFTDPQPQSNGHVKL